MTEPELIVIGNTLYVKHPYLGWMQMGSWGWEQVVR